jgi:hypothetical protein
MKTPNPTTTKSNHHFFTETRWRRTLQAIH